MFRHLKNIDSAFKYVRSFTLIIVIGSLLLTGYQLYQSGRLQEQANSRVWILAEGKALEAYSVGRKDNLPVEARDHVATFHQYFFTLSPDDKAITQTVTKALYLADGSAKQQYDNLKESGYYSGIISGNISQSLQVDSVHLDLARSPYLFRCYATQQIVRTTSIVYRKLVTEGYLRSISRSDRNPHGFLIERWTTIANEDIQVQKR
ncbi:MAG: conjugative transposon protein TraK [Chitinophagaceae bacterium]|nr:conjugative transposon protein TraK [Chitinophagaceae bacterium]